MSHEAKEVGITIDVDRDGDAVEVKTTAKLGPVKATFDVRLDEEGACVKKNKGAVSVKICWRGNRVCVTAKIKTPLGNVSGSHCVNI